MSVKVACQPFHLKPKENLFIPIYLFVVATKRYYLLLFIFFYSHFKIFVSLNTNVLNYTLLLAAAVANNDGGVVTVVVVLSL